MNREQAGAVVGQNDDWQDPNEDLAERLDRFQSRGSGSDAEQQLAWSLFTELSPYSPMRLERELGWRPVPSDLPAHCDPVYFGWTDAFEDLLTVTSARPMMSLERRQLMNQVLMNSPLRLKPFWYLYNRLSWQRLDEAYFPLYMPRQRYRSPRTMEEWVTLRKAQAGTISSDDWMKATEMLEKDLVAAMDVWPLFLSRFLVESMDTMLNGPPGANGPYMGHDSRIKQQKSPSFFSSSTAASETEEDMYKSGASQTKPASYDPLSTLFRIVKSVVTGNDEQQPQQQHRSYPEAKAAEPDPSQSVLIEKITRETEDGGHETISKRVGKSPSGEEVRVIEIERTDKLGRVTSHAVHLHDANTPREWIPSYWKKIWDSGQTAAGEKNSTDEKESK
ncbi:hypothetical protein V8F20_005043 [Naviculisporaceae sp. PSN 640]